MMNALMLDKWRQDFLTEVKALQIEYDAFFLQKKLEEYYVLNLDAGDQSLSIEVFEHDKLPREIEDRLMEIFFATKPAGAV